MSIAILTDSSVTFPHATFTGQHLVKVVSHTDGTRAALPAPEDFLNRFNQLGRDVGAKSARRAKLPAFSA